MLDLAIGKRLGAFTLDVAFTAPTSGITALFGRSGSGKTTVINAIAGLHRPDTGHIRVDDVTFFDRAARIDLPAERRRIGYVFQDSRLFPHMKVETNLRYGLRRVPKSDRRITLEPVVELLGLAPLLRRRPAGLSGGERQRVALGRALLAQPRLLLLDEPLAALDAQRKAEILPYIERLRDDLGIPMVLVSHAIDEVIRLATTLVLVADGRVRAVGSVPDLMSRLDLGHIAGPEETGAVLEARVVGQDRPAGLTVLGFPGGSLSVPLLDVPIATPLRIRVLARDVIVALGPAAGLSVGNVLPGRITDMAEAPGPAVEVRIDLGGSALIARVTAHSAKRLGLHRGLPVHALVKCVAFDRNSLGLAAAGLGGDGVLHL